MCKSRKQLIDEGLASESWLLGMGSCVVPFSQGGECAAEIDLIDLIVDLFVFVVEVEINFYSTYVVYLIS